MTTLSICWALLLAALRSQLEYRVNFVMQVLFGLVYQGTGFIFIWVVLTRFEQIAGWGLGEITFLYGLRLTVHGLAFLPLNRLILFDTFVREGDFDRLLVRPLNPLLQFITGLVRINVLGDLLGGIALFLVANTAVDVDWSPLAVLYLLLVIIGGAALEASLQVGIAALSFRLLNTRSMRIFVDNIFSNFGNYPIRIFGGGLEFVLTFIVPLAFVAYLPATVLLDRTDELHVHPLFAYLAPVVGLIWFTAAYRFWQRETRNYQSSGH